MAAHTFWQTIDHFSQLAYEWLDSSYGTAKMGTFILSYCATQDTWLAMMDTLDTLLAWLGAFIPITQKQAPHLWGVLYVMYQMELAVNASLRKLAPWLPVQPPEPEYPTLPLDPGAWFLE